MKKIFCFALAAAMTAFSASTFTSCKDYDEDRIADVVTNTDKIAAQLKEQLKKQGEELEALKQQLAAIQTNHDEDVAALNTRIDEVQTTITTLQAALEGDIEGLQTQVDDIQTQIDAIKADVDDLKEKVADIQNYLKKQITGIQVETAKNPVFGSVNTPFGINSNVLMGFYGNLEVNPSALNNTPFKGTEAGEVVSSAGQLYLTINPITNDFTGVKLNLVNTKGEVAKGVELSAVEACDEELKFGYTRADVETGAANGFYVATAEITDVEAAKLNINRDALVGAARDLYHNKLNANFTNIAKVVFDQVNGITPAYAVEAAWTEGEGEAAKTHKVVSKHEVAATAIKPLGYNSLQEFSRTTVPGLERARNFVNKWADKVLNKISFNLKEKFTIPGKIQNVTFDTKGKKYRMHIEQEVPINLTGLTIPKEQLSFVVKSEDGKTRLYLTDTFGWYYVYESLQDGNGNWYDFVHDTSVAPTGSLYEPYVFVDLGDLTISADKDIKFDIKDQSIKLDFWVDVTSFVEEIFADINASMGGFNNSIDEMNTALQQAKDLMDEIEGKQNWAKTEINNVRDRIISYLDKINNRLGKFFDFHHMLQPVMVVESGDKASHLVGTELAPQVVAAGNATVFLTSYNMDILAPAYQKCLVVEGPQNFKSEILDCCQAAVSVNLNTPGNYKFTYWAMDFYGTVVKTERYVVVK